MPEDVFRIVVTVAVALAALAFVVQAGVALALYRGFKLTQQKMDQFIGRAEPVLAKAELTFDKTGPVLEKIGPVIERIKPVIDKLSLAVDKIGPVIDKIGPVIDKIGPVIDTIKPVVAKVGPVVDKTKLLVEDVTKVVNTANEMLEENRPRIAEISDEAVAIAKTGREQVAHLGSIVHDAGERARVRLEQVDHVVENTLDQIEQVGDSVKHVGDSVKRSVLAPVKGVNGLAAGISAAVSTLIHGSRKSSVDSATQDEEMFI